MGCGNQYSAHCMVQKKDTSDSLFLDHSLAILLALNVEHNVYFCSCALHIGLLCFKSFHLSLISLSSYVINYFPVVSCTFHRPFIPGAVPAGIYGNCIIILSES
jgi:hypothetical protein